MDYAEASLSACRKPELMKRSEGAPQLDYGLSVMDACQYLE